jgi:GDP-L-fucose synthase
MIKRNSCIVVTGAAGLAGSAIVEHLRKEMFTCVVSLTRDDVDLRDYEEVHKKFALIQPDYVFHAAATVYGLGGNMRNQAKSFLENTQINTNVVDACYRVGVKKTIVMGTNAIYPDPAVLPYREGNIFNGRPHSGERGYGNAKRHMLAMLEAYESSYGMKYTYLVSGNLYGPNDRFDPENGHVLPSMIWKFYQAKKYDGEVRLWGDGSSERDFLYSDDLARIVRLMFDSPIVGAINTGNGNVYSIAEIAGALCKISGVGPERVHFDTTKPSGRKRCYSDLYRLDGTGFKPLWSIERGLQATWDWYCDNESSALRPPASSR